MLAIPKIVPYKGRVWERLYDDTNNYTWEPTKRHQRELELLQYNNAPILSPKDGLSLRVRLAAPKLDWC